MLHNKQLHLSLWASRYKPLTFKFFKEKTKGLTKMRPPFCYNETMLNGINCCFSSCCFFFGFRHHFIKRYEFNICNSDETKESLQISF